MNPTEPESFNPEKAQNQEPASPQEQAFQAWQNAKADFQQKEALHWDAEYNFWHKIISEEVERLRFNEGYEPVQVDLYPTTRKFGPAFMGKTQIGHVHFRVEGKWQFDSKGNKFLRITVLKEPQ